jgi:hypothetical protein
MSKRESVCVNRELELLTVMGGDDSWSLGGQRVGVSIQTEVMNVVVFDDNIKTFDLRVRARTNHWQQGELSKEIECMEEKKRLEAGRVGELVLRSSE